MKAARAFLRNESGAGAAEFAMVLPVAILFLLGIIDAGRYAWALNRIEKAVQAGARYAVATAIVPTDLNSKDFIGVDCGGTLPVSAGQPICEEALGTITCSKTSASVTCTCDESSLGASSCSDTTGSVNETAFNAIVGRMRVIDPAISPEVVNVSYSGSGIGYAGDPSEDDDGNDLSDVAPIVTVEVDNLQFRLFFLLGTSVSLPRFNYSLTLEDGVGSIAY